MSTQTDLAELYTTFFNRAPDAAGLTYWTNVITTGQLSLAQIAENWTTQQPEGQAAFPATLTDAQFVEKVYGNILGRTSDSAGSQYWLDQLANGTVSRDSFALTLINGAKANTSAQGVLDSTLITNKANVGVAFADKGLNDTTLAAKVLTSVSTDAASVSGTLAILSLIPSATADQSAAILASVNQLLTNLATLTTAAPGEVADASTYLQTLASGATSTTNIVTLLDNASTLLNSAATNSAALDNPAIQGAAAVVVATPGTGGGGTPTPTFTATSDLNGAVTFGGTATGDITVTVNGSDATFVRAGVSATPVTLTGTTVIELPTDAISLAVSVADSLLSAGAKFATTDAITLTGTGAALAALTFGNYSTTALGGTSVTLNASDNVVSLTNIEADALIASALKFATTDVITLTGTGAALAALTFADYSKTALGGLSVTLDASDNAVSLDKAQADALIASTTKFATTDVITLADTGAALAALTFADYKTTALGGASVVLDATDNAVSLTKTQADALIASTLKFATTDAITLAGTGSALAALTFADYSKTALGGLSVTLDASDNAVSLNKAQADALIASTTKFAATDAITLNDTGTALAGLTFANYSQTALGGTSVALDATDNAVSLTKIQVDALITSTLKFANSDALTVAVAAADEGTALTTYTQAALGGSLVSLKATDTTWTVSADNLSTASQAGVVLAAADVVTITNTLAQGLKVIGSSFQSGNDKLQFSASELTAPNFVSYSGGGAQVSIAGGNSAQLVIGTGGTLVASNAEAAFLFDTATGTLTYDADGTGNAAPAIQIVTLTGVTSLASGDFAIV